ncbi:MAG: DUF2970 domain-containing protein [Polaromonas sp.]|uniref:DUF2970 domain-containing protein n=1 Tax=Polaromonas sp. TaxID=1869339 RepID=UPI0018157EE8|nr:DUF2970 domain-containing protein [Polaromonas sp.]MBA3593326.1 DUF2970 domain-containing protein [Polaromonas sp.]
MSTPVTQRRGSIWRTVKAVGWSFVGLRARSDYEQDVAQLNPVHIVVVGLVGLLVFVGSLMLLATWVVGK